MKKLDKYQYEALLHALPGIASNTTYLTLGLCGEAGEIAEKMKKSIRDDIPLDRDRLMLELGDVLWYVAVLANAYDINLSDVATANIEKLMSRTSRGVIQGSGDFQ